MNNYKRFIKNAKAISPIFATLILIAIAVIAGVVVYMFTSGFLAGNTANTGAAQEKMTIQGSSGTTTTVTLYASAAAGSNPVLNGILVKDGTGNTVATVSAITSTYDWTNGQLNTITETLAGGPLVSGNAYTATLTTAAGGSFVSPSFIVP
jgi:archaeal type IV pilus assembly protein PilA